MWELVQITTQYSNAVLVAVMPYISDFEKKLDLPLIPLSPGQVAEFKCDPRSGEVGGALTLTNGFQFTFLDGRVSLYRSPHSYYSLQDTELAPQFFGPVRITKTEASNLALQVIRKLGYERRMFNADRPPLITPPEKVGTNFISRYRIQWLDPHWSNSTEPGSPVPTLLDIEVNASNGVVEMLLDNSHNTRRPPPKVDVVPPLLQPGPAPPRLIGGKQTSAVSDAYSASFLGAILPEISDFIGKAGLKIVVPVTTNQITNYICRILDGRPTAQLYLTNGDRFNYRQGYVSGFYAHDAFWKFPNYGNPQEFLGHVNMTTNEAISLCESVIRKLGYGGSFNAPNICYADARGALPFTRYKYCWRHPGEDAEFASIEVDMESKTIKAVFLKDRAFERESPKMGVPMDGNGPK
jgi:hypothetical protein